jgi:hypothetical protein
MTASTLVLRRFRTCHRGNCRALADVELLNIMVLRDVRICRREDAGRPAFWVETGQNLLWRNRRVAESFRKALLIAISADPPDFFASGRPAAPPFDTLQQCSHFPSKGGVG